jgi:all-trans-retinol 13,14-reductase
MKASIAYKQFRGDGPYDAIVVGSGIGGLASAALLAKHAHKRVLVLERHYVAGGFTHAFRRPGYEWDVGVHYIGEVTRPTLLRRVFDDVTDGALEWADMGEVYDTFVFGDERYPLRAGRENLRADLHAWFPSETRAIDRYFDLVRRTVRRSQLYFAEKALPGPLASILGGALRWPSMRAIRRTTLEVLSTLTTNRRLIAVLAGQWPDYGLPPAQGSFFIHAMVAAHYFRGGAYPVGGASRIAETIAPVITREGGAVVTSAEVAKILVEEGRAVGVRLADGRDVRAPLVISDAGVPATYGRLLDAEHAEQSGWPELREKVKPSVAHASLYLGFRKTARELALPKGNVWIYPGHDHDENVARFLADPDAELPILFLSFPSAKDPSFEDRHPGRATMEAVTMLPYEPFAAWADTRWKKRGADYDALKARLTARILEMMRAHFPAAVEAVDHAELSTPLSTRHFAGHEHGEIYGLAHTPARFEARQLRPQTAIRGLYLTGADICSAGVAGALMGGVLTASAVLRRNLIGAIAKRRPGPRGAEVHARPVEQV